MRRFAAVLLTLALAVAGVQVAHALTYRLAEPDPSARAEVLAATGHGYQRHATLGIALVLAVLALALAWEAAGIRAGRRGAPLRAGQFLAVAPVTFVAQEHLERFLEGGGFPWAAMADPMLLLGLLIQVPFALAACALGRALLRVVQVVVQLFEQPRPAPRAEAELRCLPSFVTARAFELARAIGPRGPPAPAS